MSCNKSVNQQNQTRQEESLTGKKVLYVYGGWEGLLFIAGSCGKRF